MVVFDPKDDEFLTGILHDAARENDKEFIYINLRKPEPQINPFKNTSLSQAELLLQVGLNLEPSGNPSVDFYRGEDRDAATSLVAATEVRNILNMLQVGAGISAVNDRQNFWREFKDLARLEAFQTDERPDIENCIKNGGVVYVVGDTDDLKIVAAQKILLAKVIQIIKDRERDGAKNVTLFLDEFKYMLSNTALRALGTIRDRKCNLVLAYQSFGDLEDCGTLNAKAVLGAAKGNTTIKFVYKLEDAGTAKEFSDIAGDESYIAESTGKIMQDGLEAGQYSEQTKKAVSVAMLTTAMPKPVGNEASVCWVFGLGAAFPLATMHKNAGTNPRINPLSRVPISIENVLNAQNQIAIDSKKTEKKAPKNVQNNDDVQGLI